MGLNLFSTWIVFCFHFHIFLPTIDKNFVLDCRKIKSHDILE